MYLSQDPIGLEGDNPTMYGYVHDPNSWVDVFGLECSNFNGKRGEKIAAYDLRRNGFDIVGEQVPMKVNGHNIRADFVATRNGKVYVFESKMNSGRLTPAQKSSKVFSTKKADIANTSSSGGGTIKTSKGRSGKYTDANGNNYLFKNTKTDFLISDNIEDKVGKFLNFVSEELLIKIFNVLEHKSTASEDILNTPNYYGQPEISMLILCRNNIELLSNIEKDKRFLCSSSINKKIWQENKTIVLG
jgi:uncharacterized protein RhaS with RHS repeats